MRAKVESMRWEAAGAWHACLSRPGRRTEAIANYRPATETEGRVVAGVEVEVMYVGRRMMRLIRGANVPLTMLKL